jgi:hypothetical protein
MSFNHGNNKENQHISAFSFQNNFQNNPYGLFLFALKAPETKRQYPKILKYIFDYFVKIGALKNLEIEKQCIEFKTKTIENPQWALESLLKFMVFQKERIEKKEIVPITVKNYLKVIKLFIEMNFDAFPIAWKKLTRGLPPIREAANDRAPLVEEIKKLIQYPDRRIKAIILSMISGGFRHKSFMKYAISYDVLSSFIDKDVVFTVFDVKRADNKNNNISSMHYLPFFGNDIYAVETPKMINFNKPNIPKANNIKFFNPFNLIIEESEKRIKDSKRLMNEIKEEHNIKLQSICNSFDVIENDPYKVNIFKSLSKVHEIKASTLEFIKFQKWIKSNETSEYVKEKEFLKKSLEVFHSKKK